MPDEDARLTDFTSTDDGTADGPANGDGPAAGPASGAEGPPEDDQSTGDGGEESTGNDGEESPGGDPPGDGPAGNPPDVCCDPAVPTSAWRPGGVCAACGDPDERRWRDDGGFACADCKEW